MRPWRLDDFKGVDDTLGHAVGDLLLSTVTERLRACVRVGDTVARLGGDEFGVVLPTLDDVAEAQAVIDRIQSARPGRAAAEADLARYQVKRDRKARQPVPTPAI